MLRERFFVQATDTEKGLQPRLCDRVIFAEEGSELDDVGNEVFAEDDVAYEGAVVIYQFTIQEKNISGLLRADFDTFLVTPHFLGYIRKGCANFHFDS